MKFDVEESAFQVTLCLDDRATHRKLYLSNLNTSSCPEKNPAGKNVVMSC